MRTTGLGALIGAGLMLLAVLILGTRNEAGAQQRSPVWKRGMCHCMLSRNAMTCIDFNLVLSPTDELTPCNFGNLRVFQLNRGVVEDNSPRRRVFWNAANRGR